MKIYRIQSKIDGKKYIGQTMKNLSSRISAHIRSKSYIGNALRKYGLQSFDILVIDNADDRETLNEKERYWISFYDCKHPDGYNFTNGGEGHSGFVQSLETRQKRVKTRRDNSELFHSKESNIKRSASLKNHPVSNETRRKISETGKGRPPWNKGIPCTEETKRKIGEKNKGKTRSLETKEKIRIKSCQRKHTQEELEKMRKPRSEQAKQNMRGHVSSLKGKPWSYKRRESYEKKKGNKNT